MNISQQAVDAAFKTRTRAIKETCLLACQIFVLFLPSKCNASFKDTGKTQVDSRGGREKTLHTMGISSCVSSERLLADKQAGGGWFTFSLCGVFFFSRMHTCLAKTVFAKKKKKIPPDLNRTI